MIIGGEEDGVEPEFRQMCAQQAWDLNVGEYKPWALSEGLDNPTVPRRAAWLQYNELRARALGFGWVWYIVANEISGSLGASFQWLYIFQPLLVNCGGHSALVRKFSWGRSQMTCFLFLFFIFWVSHLLIHDGLLDLLRIRFYSTNSTLLRSLTL